MGLRNATINQLVRIDAEYENLAEMQAHIINTPFAYELMHEKVTERKNRRDFLIRLMVKAIDIEKEIEEEANANNKYEVVAE